MDAQLSAIDVIRGAWNMGLSSLLVRLQPEETPETVRFDKSKDIGLGGLVLNSGNSPAVVIIDGGGRVMTGSSSTANGAALVSVGDGVKLTLRNIVFKGLDKTKDSANDLTDNAAPSSG